MTPTPSRAAGPTRGRAAEYANQALFAQQVVRLTDAGAPLAEVDPLEVLDLLRLRKPERGGLAGPTLYRWRRRAQADPDAERAALLELVKEHDPGGWFRAQVIRPVHTETDPEVLREITANLLHRLGPADADIVQAELTVLAAMHQRAGRAAARAAADELCADLQTYATEGTTAEDYRRRLSESSSAAPADAQTLHEETTALAGLAVHDRADARRELRARTPGPALTALAEHTPELAVALVERAVLDVELGAEAGSAPPSPGSHTGQVLRTHLPQLLNHDGCGAVPQLWAAEPWRDLALRAAAAAALTGTADVAALLAAAHPATGEPASLATRCGHLRPALLAALAADPQVGPTVRGALSPEQAKRVSWGIPNATRDGWLSVVATWAGEHESSPQVIASTGTVVRNLLQLRQLLEQGHRADERTRRELLRAMNDVAAQLTSPGAAGPPRPA